MVDLNKIALVTGAGNRIGRALALRLGREDYSVVVHYNSSAEGADETVALIKSHGGRAQAIGANLLDRPVRDQLIANAAKIFGPLTLLVNNASVFEPDSVETLSYDLWDQHFGLHAEAPLFLAKSFAGMIPSDQTANIINIIDERVLRTSAAYMSYNLSKSVLWTATRTMAQSLAPHIRVNAIGPGPTLPNSRQTQQEFDADVAALPLQQAASPDDIASAMMFLLNTPSMTGQILALDGGEHLDARNSLETTPNLGTSND